MFIWSYGIFPAEPPQVGFPLMGSGKEFGVVPWLFSGLEVASQMFNDKALGWNFDSQNEAKVSG